MKKFFSLLLVLAVAIIMSVYAYAASSVTVDFAPRVNNAYVYSTVDGRPLYTVEVNVVAAEELEGEAAEVYTALSEVKNVAEICKNIEEVLIAIDADVRVEDIVVRDVFAVEFDAVTIENTYVVVTFDYLIKTGEVLIVLQYIDSEWVALDPELFEVVDGQVIVKLKDPGVLAFVTRAV